MCPNQKDELLLSRYRVLDLTDEKGFFCGKILGQLGADVIKIEPPGGESGRNIGPFYHGIAHPEKSLYWFAYNTDKRGVTLNMETREGQKIFKRLVKVADFVIESFPPSYMDRLGLGYQELSEINPRLIVTSITHFGQTGPYRDYKGADIVDMALSGFMYLCGDSDRPPVRISFPQAYAHAGAEAAAATMIAHYARETTGEGQHVDVSVVESIMWCMMAAQQYWDLLRIKESRMGPYWMVAATGSSSLLNWRCKDGYITYGLWGGITFAPSMQRLVEWMDSEGMAPDFLRAVDWERLFDVSVATQENFDRVSKPIINFFLTHAKAELYDEAVRRRIMLYPVSDAKDIAESLQLEARDFWEEVPHPELGVSLTYPGPFAKMSETPLRIRRRAPLIGEHNEEIYGRELGISKKELGVLKLARII